ncbi:MAG TPA: hypothetical protein PKD92_06845 [Novosphingobium sp.]|nr:hypothetical protein [Novosphingobium sp.]
MSATKIIAIVVLLVLGAHLLMFGYLRRRIAEAVAEAKKQEGRSPGGETPPGAAPSQSPDADQNGRL